MGKLAALKVRKITRKGLHGDGDTLYLSVVPGGRSRGFKGSRSTVGAVILGSEDFRS